MTFDISNNLNLKYQRFTSFSCRDIVILEIEICGKDSIHFACIIEKLVKFLKGFLLNHKNLLKG